MTDSFTFTAPLWRWQARQETADPSAWCFVTVPAEVCDEVRLRAGEPRGFGSVRVRVEVGGSRWDTSVFPDDAGSGGYVLPVKKSVRRAEGVEVAASKSSPVDIVTDADRETEALIRGLLAEARPLDGFFGEESDAAESESGLTWIVDPIDGTVNFLYGIPHYAVSIAVVEGGPDPLTWRALAACVFNPATGEVYTAAEGSGAFLGEQQLHVASTVPLSQALVGTGFAYDSGVRAQQGAAAAKLLPLVRDLRRMGTASLDLCAVAAGRLNAYYERTLSPWDHAAGALIAREAGATVKGLGDAAPSRDFILAAEPQVAELLEAALTDLGV